MAKALYHSLAKYHDLLTQRDYKKESEMLINIFNKYGKSIHKVLDLACGTGMHMKYLIEYGYDVTGVDLSGEMLEVASTNAPKAKLVMDDVRRLSLPSSYDAAIFMGTTFNYFLTDDDFIAMENAVTKLLKNLLILDTTNFSNKDNLKEIVKAEQAFENNTAKFNSLRTVFFKDGLRHLIYHHRITYKKTGKVEEYDDEAIGKAYTLDDLVKLTSNRFELIDSYGGYDLSQYSQKSRRLITVFKKNEQRI